ncbi:MAG TPA: hypothetical protein VKV06_07615 [Acidimicrobiales bacterium]|nr:hypothetical protein [Acidimicrobiales bacterium]
MHRFLVSGLLSAGIAGGAVLAASGLASAQTPLHLDCYATTANCSTHTTPPTLPTDPLPVTHSATPVAAPSTTVPPAVNAQPVATSSLAFTGIDVAGVTGVGVLLIGGGTVLVRTSRRRPSA